MQNRARQIVSKILVKAPRQETSDRFIVKITGAAPPEWLGKETAEGAFHDGETEGQKHGKDVAGEFVEPVGVVNEAVFSGWGGFGDNEEFGFEAELADLETSLTCDNSSLPLPVGTRCHTMSIVTSPAIVQGRTVLGPCSNRTVPPSCSTCLERSHPPNRED